MKDITSTAAIIGLIAVVIATMFLAPKGFQLGEPDPIVTEAEAAEMDLTAE